MASAFDVKDMKLLIMTMQGEKNPRGAFLALRTEGISFLDLMIFQHDTMMTHINTRALRDHDDT